MRLYLILLMVLITCGSYGQQKGIPCQYLDNHSYYYYPMGEASAYEISTTGDLQYCYVLDKPDSAVYSIEWGGNCSYFASLITDSRIKYLPDTAMHSLKANKIRHQLVSMGSNFLVFRNEGDGKDKPPDGFDMDTLWTQPKTVDDRDTSLFERDAHFPGGIPAWNNYISKSLNDNGDELLREMPSGLSTCKINFIIDMDGNITSVEPKTGKGTVLADVAVKAIKKSPKWIPARRYGKPVKAYRTQPFSFNMEQ